MPDVKLPKLPRATLIPCPKCKAKNSITTKYYGYVTSANVCMICGCSHQIGALRESLERQVAGTRGWVNPRIEKPVRINATSEVSNGN